MNVDGVKRFLAALGADTDSIVESDHGWINCRCPLAQWTHGSGEDQHPSFGVSVSDTGWSVYYCLAGETCVLTDAGTFAIKDMAGASHNILTTGGVWTHAYFRSYGRQRLYRIRLLRNQKVKVIHATGEHRWFVRKSGGSKVQEKTTKELFSGERLEACSPIPAENYALDSDAIKRGFIYGDGTLSGRFGAKVSQALFCGDSLEYMRPYFMDCVISPKGEQGKLHEYHSKTQNGVDQYIIRGFERLWKTTLPELSRSRDYLAGFLAGWIAADGCVDEDGLVMLNSACSADLQYARDLATNIGLVTFGIARQMRRGLGKEKSALYRVNFARKGFPRNLLLSPKHRGRFESIAPKYTRLKWKVGSVCRTDRVEEVYCCEVPETHAFVLEDFILTGNCFGCSSEARPLNWLLHNIWLMSGSYPWEAAREYIRWEIHEHERKRLEIPDVWAKPRPKRMQPLPGKVLRKFPLLQGAKGFEPRRCREFLERERGIPEYIQNFCGLRYFEEMQAIAFPLTDVNGSVFMLRLRKRKEKRIMTVSPKIAGFPWMRFPSIKRDIGAWFGMHLVDWSLPVMCVEGELDHGRLLSLGYFNVVASTTSSVTDRQIAALASDVLILGYDADAAGEHACRRIQGMVEGKALLLKANWALAEKGPGVPCKDAGDLPSEEQLQVVLNSLEQIT